MNNLIWLMILIGVALLGLLWLGYETNWFRGLSRSVIRTNRLLAILLGSIALTTLVYFGISGIVSLPY